MSSAPTPQPMKFTSGAPYHASGSLVGVQNQKLLTRVAKGSSPKSNSIVRTVASPITQNPYERVLRQGRMINRAVPRDARIAVTHINGTAQGSGWNKAWPTFS